MPINITPNGKDLVNQYNYYGIVGTTAVQIVGTSVPTAPTAQQIRQFLAVHNPAAAGPITFTTDGTTPVLNTTGITVNPGLTAQFPQGAVPPGAITVIGSAASSPYAILSM